MKAALLTTILFLFPAHFKVQISFDFNSPNSLLYGLLGLFLVGVIQAIYTFTQLQRGTIK